MPYEADLRGVRGLLSRTAILVSTLQSYRSLHMLAVFIAVQLHLDLGC